MLELPRAHSTRACPGIAASTTAAAGTRRRADARSRSRRRRRGSRWARRPTPPRKMSIVRHRGASGVLRVARYARAGTREGDPQAVRDPAPARRRARVARGARHRQSVPGDALRRRDQRRVYGLFRRTRHRDQGQHDPDRRRHAQLHAARTAGRGRHGSARSTIRCSSPPASAARRWSPATRSSSSRPIRRRCRRCASPSSGTTSFRRACSTS